jgi:hypothetical protein
MFSLPRRAETPNFMSKTVARGNTFETEVEWYQSVNRGDIHVSNEKHVAPQLGRQSQGNNAA